LANKYFHPCVFSIMVLSVPDMLQIAGGGFTKEGL